MFEVSYLNRSALVVHTWFLEIAFVHNVCVVYVYVPAPGIFHNLWHDLCCEMDPVQWVKQVLQPLAMWQLYSVLLVGLALELKHVINKTIVLYKPLLSI